MKYILDISPTAEEALDRIIEETQDDGLFEAMDSLFDEIARHPVSVMRRYPGYSEYPYAVGSYKRYVFLIAWTFREDEKWLYIIGVAYIKV